MAKQKGKNTVIFTYVFGHIKMAISYFYLFVWPYKDGYQLFLPFCLAI
jgi:hypothetical protein